MVLIQAPQIKNYWIKSNNHLRIKILWKEEHFQAVLRLQEKMWHLIKNTKSKEKKVLERKDQIYSKKY
jgi:hypothetical protein